MDRLSEQYGRRFGFDRDEWHEIKLHLFCHVVGHTLGALLVFFILLVCGLSAAH